MSTEASTGSTESTATQTSVNNGQTVSRETSTPQQEVASRNSAQKSDSTTQAVENMSQAELEEFLDLDQYANKKIKRKINGKEETFTLKDIVEGFQTRKASDEKFREAAMKEKKSEEFVKMLRTDPLKVLSHPALGLDLRNLAESYLVQQLEDEMMDPKDKKLREYERKIAEIEAREKAQREAEENERISQLKEHYTNEYSNDIVSALNDSGLPRTEHTVKRMAYYMHQALKNGYDLKAKDVVEYVRKDYIEEQKSLFGAMDGDVLSQLLGDDVVGKIRKADLKRFKQKNPLGTPKRQPQVIKKHNPNSKKMTKDQWREHLNKKRT